MARIVDDLTTKPKFCTGALPGVDHEDHDWERDEEHLDAPVRLRFQRIEVVNAHALATGRFRIAFQISIAKGIVDNRAEQQKSTSF